MPLVILDAKLERPSWLSRSDFTQKLKLAHYDLGRFWASKILKKHFTPEGAAEYGFTMRTEKYRRRKLRKRGHQDPNVWTGRTKRNLLQRSGVSISATSRSVTITLHPGGGYRHEDFADEMTAVSARDRRRLTVHLVNSMRKRLAGYAGLARR